MHKRFSKEILCNVSRAYNPGKDMGDKVHELLNKPDHEENHHRAMINADYYSLVKDINEQTRLIVWKPCLMLHGVLSHQQVQMI